jgi:YcxB-like protein
MPHRNKLLSERRIMEVTTNIQKMDLIKLNLSVALTMKSTYISVLVIAGFVFAFLLWKKGIPSTDKRWMTMIIASVSGGLIGTIASMLFNMFCILTMLSKNAGVLGEHHYQVLADGLHEKTSANEGLSRWQGIAEIRATNSYLFYRITGYLYHIIPKRSFNSQKDFDQFYLKSKQYWEEGHNQSLQQISAE